MADATTAQNGQPYRARANVNNVTKEMAEVVLRQAELYIDELHSSINSILSRATGLIGVYTAGTVAGIAALWEMSDGLEQIQQHLFVTMLVSFTILWLLAAVMCAVILRPRPTRTKGNEPRNWLDHPQLVEGDLASALIGEAEGYQDRISDILSRSLSDACCLRIAIWSGIAAPVVMGLIGVGGLLTR